jgi:integrase
VRCAPCDGTIWFSTIRNGAVIWIRRAISTDEDDRWVEGGTKTHQQRRVALDVDTALVLVEHRGRAQARVAALGEVLSDDAFVFSLDPIGATFMLPGSVSQRYDRLVCRLGIRTTLHKLRHYSATELILAGVDVRTVGGRLGHVRGSTTLDVYAAFVSEADQRAAGTLSARMPVRPELLDRADRAKEDPQAPYEHIAATMRRRILNGEILPGQFTRSIHELASEFGVSSALRRGRSRLSRSGIW